MKLHLTIDHGTDERILEYLEKAGPAVDIVEIGYPVLVTYGLTLVKAIHDRYPDLALCVDAKVFHGGTGVTERCFEAGASIVTVLSAAPNPVITRMVEKAQRYGGKVMCDMSCGAATIGRRASEVDELGVDYVAVHPGFLPEYDYDIDAHRRLIRPTVRPLDLAGVVKRNIRHAGLALNTGINESTIKQVVALNPQIIMVGRAILDADDPVVAASRLRRYMPFDD